MGSDPVERLTRGSDLTRRHNLSTILETLHHDGPSRAPVSRPDRA